MTIARSAIRWTIVGAVAFVGLKSCTVTVWSAPSTAEAYSITGSDGRQLKILLLPKNEAFFLYTPDRGRSIEVNHSKLRGVVGTHYLSGLWNVSGPQSAMSLFNYKIYPLDATPVRMENIVLKKYVRGSQESALPPSGTTTYPIFLFFSDRLEFEGMPLAKRAAQPEEIEMARALIQ